VNQFALEKLMERLTSEGQAETLARAYLLFGDLAMADDFVRRLRKVELSAVRRVAGKWFQGIQYGYLGDTVLMQNKW
jgi:predicted Zn-dependent peptidase